MFFISQRSVVVGLSVCVLAFRSLAYGGLTDEQQNVLRAISKGRSKPWVDMTAGQASALFTKAENQQKRTEAYCMPHGQIGNIWWSDKQRSTADRYEGIGDAAAWTGHYLAALALRYKVKPSEEIRTKILEVLDTFDVLTTVTGRDGYIARYAGPADDKAYQAYYSRYGRGEDPERPGLGNWAYRGAGSHKALVWLGYSSRDTFDGSNFGLATVWTHVDDQRIRDRVRELVVRIGDQLIEDEFTIRDGKGHVTPPTSWFRLTWTRTLLSVCGKRFAALEEDYGRRLKTMTAQRLRVTELTGREYFANNLRFIRLYVLCTLENDAGRKAALQRVLRKMYEQTKAHLNAHFAAIYMAGTGDTQDNDARALVQGLLVDFPAGPKWMGKVDHRNSLDIEKRDEHRAKYALLSRERVMRDFIWQRSALELHYGQDLPFEYPGLDVFLPYWMGRVTGVILPP